TTSRAAPGASTGRLTTTPAAPRCPAPATNPWPSMAAPWSAKNRPPSAICRESVWKLSKAASAGPACSLPRVAERTSATVRRMRQLDLSGRGYPPLRDDLLCDRLPDRSGDVVAFVVVGRPVVRL